MSVAKELIFLSYAREDRTAASRLYHEMTEAGLNVWFDQESLVPGGKWKPAIRSSIRDCRYFIALMSSRSVSKKGFVNSELKQAIEILDEFPENASYLIPVRLDACEAPHDTLNELQWVDLYPDWEMGANKLLRLFGVLDSETKTQIERQVKSSAQSGIPVAGVRVDGLYRSKTISDDHFIRFYEDGLVITASVTGPGSPKEAIEWFNREKFTGSYDSRGVYSIDGSEIRFSSTSSVGTLDYEGEIQGNNLVLRIYSHINGHKGIEEFKFIPIDQ